MVDAIEYRGDLFGYDELSMSALLQDNYRKVWTKINSLKFRVYQ
jgi:hypothetical protein